MLHRWMRFYDHELETLKRVLDDYCERYEDTCEAEEALADELDDELRLRATAWEE